jgi:SAM-dependent methyltransferase
VSGSELEAGRLAAARLKRRGPLGVLSRFLASSAALPFINGPAMMLPERLDLRPEHQLLDVGCGSGALARLLHTLVAFRSPPIGLDVARPLLRSGKRGDPPIQLVQALAGRLPLRGSSVDVALLSHVVGMMDDGVLEASLREIRRVLKPGGICLLWDYAPRSDHRLNRFNKAFVKRFDQPRKRWRSAWQLASEASDAAFAEIRVIPFGPFYWPPIPRVALLLQRAGRPSRRAQPR